MHVLSQYLSSALSGPVAELTILQIVLALLVAFVAGAQSAATVGLLPNVAFGIAAILASPPRAGRAYLAYAPVASRFALGFVLTFALFSFEAGWNGRPFPSWLATPGGLAFWLIALGAWIFTYWRKRQPVLTERTSNGLSFGLGFLAATLPSQCHPVSFPVILLYIAQSRALVLGLAITFAYAVGLSTLPFLCAWFSGGLRRK